MKKWLALFVVASQLHAETPETSPNPLSEAHLDLLDTFRNWSYFSPVEEPVGKTYGDTLNELLKQTNSQVSQKDRRISPTRSQVTSLPAKGPLVSDTQLHGGIGAVIQVRQSQPVVAELVPGLPAEKAGIEVGDIIISVSGTPVSDYAFPELVTFFIHGRPGTELDLVVSRRGEIHEFLLKRVFLSAQVGIVSVDIDESGLYTIEVRYFSDKSLFLITLLIERFASRGIPYALDLSECEGGSLEHTNAFFAMFVGRDTFVASEERKTETGISTFNFFAEGEGKFVKALPQKIFVSPATKACANYFARMMRFQGIRLEGRLLPFDPYTHGLFMLPDSSGLLLITGKLIEKPQP